MNMRKPKGWMLFLLRICFVSFSFEMMETFKQVWLRICLQSTSRIFESPSFLMVDWLSKRVTVKFWLRGMKYSNQNPNKRKEPLKHISYKSILLLYITAINIIGGYFSNAACKVFVSHIFFGCLKPYWATTNPNPILATSCRVSLQDWIWKVCSFRQISHCCIITLHTCSHRKSTGHEITLPCWGRLRQNGWSSLSHPASFPFWRSFLSPFWPFFALLVGRVEATPNDCR